MDIPDEIKCSERSPEQNLTSKTKLILKTIYKLTGKATSFCIYCQSVDVELDLNSAGYKCLDCGKKFPWEDLIQNYPIEILT